MNSELAGVGTIVAYLCVGCCQFNPATIFVAAIHLFCHDWHKLATAAHSLA
ncbi:hypothetical protein [Chamaesiphon minutus]|uniref:hypothetical protein n=1 Tax=Chamaesiphon minutus TaxID=1173032 RepID=UPI000312946E|nr:hypothetical protein [Chamaesiphon minutus]